MPIINNIGALKQNLRENGWHMTAFEFQYKRIEYDVLFEDLDNLKKKERKASVRLTFIDTFQPNRIYSVEANQYQMFFTPKEFREYFGIKYSPNLGDVFKQFYDRFIDFVPAAANEHLNDRQNNEIDRALAQNGTRDPNAIYCYDARRLGKRDGNQMHRSIFISNLTKRKKPNLYAHFERETTITFFFSPDPTKELSTIEIINNFAKRESQKGKS